MSAKSTCNFLCKLLTNQQTQINAGYHITSLVEVKMQLEMVAVDFIYCLPQSRTRRNKLTQNLYFIAGVRTCCDKRKYVVLQLLLACFILWIFYFYQMWTKSKETVGAECQDNMRRFVHLSTVSGVDSKLGYCTNRDNARCQNASFSEVCAVQLPRPLTCSGERSRQFWSLTAFIRT